MKVTLFSGEQLKLTEVNKKEKKRPVAARK